MYSHTNTKFVCSTDIRQSPKFWMGDERRTEQLKIANCHGQSHKCAKLLSKCNMIIYMLAQCGLWWATNSSLNWNACALMVAAAAAETAAASAIAVIFAGKFVYRLHTFLLTHTKHNKTIETRGRRCIQCIGVGCTHTHTHIYIWNFSRIDFIAFYFYVCFNNMPVTVYLILLTLWRKNEPNIYTCWLCVRHYRRRHCFIRKNR